MPRNSTWIAVLICLLFTTAVARLVAAPPDADGRVEFTAWLTALRAEARTLEVSDATLDAALAEIAPIERVIELDRRQPESTMTFDAYLDLVVNDKRVRDGRDRLWRHRELLAEIQQRYGVQARFIVALWGVESDFGRRTGSFRVVPALATLAWDGRRSRFFRGELLDALQILEEGHIPPERMLGSWAGAMGQPQFMPSSFRRYAVDHDGDTRRDIWNSTPDALASAANYLAREGWNADLIWGREVRLPEGFDAAGIGRDKRQPLGELQQRGVRRRDGSDLPRADVQAALIQPGGPAGPTFVVYENFRVLLRWNRSDYFATAVGILSDRIAGRTGG